MPMAINRSYHPLRKYSGYQKRSIMYSKRDSPLRVLTCISRQHHVSAITNFLTLSGPTASNPLMVHVLHLINLVGRAQPIFISHDLQQKKSSLSKFDDMIWAFNAFKASYVPSALSMHYYTIVSPAITRHEDVCTLSLDTLSALIVLPFHRKINIDGNVDLDDHDQRTLNRAVLDLAPCSVGILIDRGSSKITHTSSMSRTSISMSSVTVEEPLEEAIHVAVIFIGGKDDQEAVAYAKRIVSPMVKVQVIRLAGFGEERSSLSMMDSLALAGVGEYNNPNSNRLDPHADYIGYVEKVVTEGSETTKFLRSIVKEFDLVIVGRRAGLENCTQTEGLEEWSEFSELGVLGDLMAQPDFGCGTTSVLVIQQQKQWTFKNDAAALTN